MDSPSEGTSELDGMDELVMLLMAKGSLLKIGAKHTAKDGQDRSLEDIVKLLIQERTKRR